MGVFMNKILIICITVLIAGCNQQFNFGERVAKKHLAEANRKIEYFLVVLDDPLADKDDQEYILCFDYPKIYKYEFVPAMLKLSDDEPKEKLIDEFKNTTEYYTQKLKIVCE